MILRQLVGRGRLVFVTSVEQIRAWVKADHAETTIIPP